MTLAQAQAAVGSTATAGLGTSPHCKTVTYNVNGAQASATVHDKEAAVIQITTPSGTKTDRGVGDGSTTTQVIAAYSRDHAVKQDSTQAGAGGHLCDDGRSQPGWVRESGRLDRIRDQGEHGGAAGRGRHPRV